MRAGVYTRLSKAKDTEEATEDTIDRQEERCRDLCSAKDWEVVEVYKDVDISAYRAQGKKSSPLRPDFERMLRDAEARKLGVIVFTMMDRLVRDHGDFERVLRICERSGTKLAAVKEPLDTTSPAGEAMARMMVTFARLSSQQTSQRVTMEREQAARNGKKNPGGRRIFGYDYVPAVVVHEGGKRRVIEPGYLVVNEGEAEVIRKAAKRIIRGDSVRSVTAWMNTISRTTGGNEWSQQTVRPLLRSPAIAGRRTYHGQLHEGDWKAILDWETWEALQAVFEARRKGPKALGRSSKYLLSGLCVCGLCDTTLDNHHEPKRRGGRRRYLCTRHPGRRGCGKIMASAEPLEALVSEQVLQALIDPRLQDALSQRPNVDSKVVADKNAAEARLIEIGEMYASGEIDRPVYLRMSESVSARIKLAQDLLAQQSGSEVLTDLPKTEARLREFWAGADLEQKRAIIKAVMTKVIVGPSSKSNGPKFDARRIAPPWGIQWRV